MKVTAFALSLFFAAAPLQAMTFENVSKPDTLSLTGTAQPLSFPVPGKFGAVLASRFPNRWQVEGAYASGTTGIGYSRLKILSLREENFTLRGRRFFGRSFHTFVGLGERRMTVETMPQLSRFQEPQKAIVRTPFIEWGIGSEWRPYRGLSVGLEWFGLAIPVGRSGVTERGSLIEDEPMVERAFRLAGGIPGARFMTLQIGWVFYDRHHLVKTPALDQEPPEAPPSNEMERPEEALPRDEEPREEEGPFEEGPPVDVIQTSLP